MAEIGGILIVIPARGGSKRLPRKNVMLLAGKPLICWTIEAALEASLDARILVTSDDDEILDIANQYKSKGVVIHKRRSELATDTASTADVITDAVIAEQRAGRYPSILVLLQPTSPLRNADDIRAALQVYQSENSGLTVVTVCEVDHPTAWVGTIDSNLCFSGTDLSGKRSQDCKKEYRLNGAVYVAQTKKLMQSRSLFTDELRASFMPRVRSFDIDEEIDLRICSSLLNN